MADEPTAPAEKPDSTPGQNDLSTGTGQTGGTTGSASDAPQLDFKDRIIANKSFELREKTRQVNELSGRVQALEAVVKSGGQPPESATPPAPATTNLSPQEIDARVEAAANAKLAERAFNEACNNAWNSGLKEYPDFQQRYVQAFMIGGEPPPVDFLQTVVKLKDPHKVLYTLSKDPAEANRIMSLPRDERTVELARLESKTVAPPPKVSGAAPPIRPVEAKRPSTGPVDLYDPNTPTDDWMAKRTAEKRARFEQQARRRA